MIAQLARGEVNTYMWEVRPDEDARGGLFWFGETENAGIVAAEDEAERARRFRILSFGREGGDARSIVDMELIWIVALMELGKNPAGLISALRGADPWCGSFDEAAAEAGLEYQVDAYLSGAPLEHVLSDVRFEPARRVLDYPWPDGIRSS